MSGTAAERVDEFGFQFCFVLFSGLGPRADGRVTSGLRSSQERAGEDVSWEQVEPS